jgi:exoribonuclease II
MHMSDERPRIQHGSARGEALVAAWNRSDRAYVVDQLAETVRLEAARPKMPEPAAVFRLTSKAEFEAELAAYAGSLPAFEIVGLFEQPNTICLVLDDADGDALAVTIEMDEAGKIERIISYRAGAESE